MEDDLKPRECVVYRDFVSQYLFGAELLGQKMNNLQLVLVWRDEAGSLTSLKVANFCGDKHSNAHDAYFTADVFNFHLGTPKDEGEKDFFSGLFASSTQFILSGTMSTLQLSADNFQ